MGCHVTFAIAWRPRFSRFRCGAFGFANRDHLLRVRACQLTPAGETAAAANLREILADIFLRLRHFLDPSAGVAPALQFNGLNHAS